MGVHKASAIGGETAAERLGRVRDGIARACRAAGRDPSDVTLIAVSKTFEAAEILPLIEAGQRVFGENRVQEAVAKWPPLLAHFPDIALHHVGQLQSNKTMQLVQLVQQVHSLDRLSVIQALAKARFQGPVFIQVNIGAEDQKGGCAIDATAPLLAEARAQGLDVCGLMCVPPVGPEPAPYFALLAKMARELGLPKLSMGMSGDYETAVMLGATHVRVGSALFGTRAGA